MTTKALPLLASALLLLGALSCSTTKLLPEGSSRLAQNKIEVVKGKHLDANDLSQYIRQQPNKYLMFGWNPLINVYNWSDGSGKGINKVFEKIGEAPVEFDPYMVEASIENITRHLDYIGYYNSEVSSQVNTVERISKVKYIVNPGKRYRIDRIVYEVPEGDFAEAFYADTANITVKRGSYLSARSLELESERSAKALREKGYYDLSKANYFFEADTLGPRTILYYRIHPYTRNDVEKIGTTLAKYSIGDVTITHPDDIPFNHKLIVKLNTVKPGMTYSESMVSTTYNRLSALKVFNTVSIEMTPADSAVVDCDITLSGNNVFGFKLNAEASVNNASLFGVSPQLSFFHKNLFHSGEWLNIGVTGNFQAKPRTDIRSNEFGVSASLSIPKLVGMPLKWFKGANIPRTELKTSYNYQNRPEYRRSVANVSYGFTGQNGKGFFYQLYPFQLNLVRLYDLSESFAQTIISNPFLWDTFSDKIDLGVGTMLYYTTDADIVPKKPYHYLRLNFDLSGNFLSLFNNSMPIDPDTGQHTILGLPYNQYVRAELALGKTFRFGKNDSKSLALRLDLGAGYAYGNSSAMPFEKQFYCGGASSMRGWQARSLGPGFDSALDFFVIPCQVGNFKFEADLEYRFPLFWKFEGAMFAEVGNVWDKLSSAKDMARSLAADLGLGLRVNLDFILLRLDAGFKLHDPSRPEGERWRAPDKWIKRDGFSIHFGVGYPF